MEAPDPVVIVDADDPNRGVRYPVGERTSHIAFERCWRSVYHPNQWWCSGDAERQFLSTRTDRDGGGGLHPDRADAHADAQPDSADAHPDGSPDFLRHGESARGYLSLERADPDPEADGADLRDADPRDRVQMDGATAIHYAHAQLLRQRRAAMKPKRRPRTR